MIDQCLALGACAPKLSHLDAPPPPTNPPVLPPGKSPPPPPKGASSQQLVGGGGGSWHPEPRPVCCINYPELLSLLSKQKPEATNHLAEVVRSKPGRRI